MSIKPQSPRPSGRFLALLVGLCTMFLTCAALANPVLNNISSGNVSIQNAPNSTTINQSSQKAIINWQSFNIGNQEATHFQQPAGGVALNRISAAQGASQIYGTLTATGKIILANPAGIYFGPSAFVNVGGLIATTANITDQNFLNGIYQFEKVPGYSGAIVNEGQIYAAEHGLVALVAPGVVNNGLIQANMGHVVLASGEAFTMSFSGDNLINFTIDAKTSSRGVDKDGNSLRDGVSNTGTILADGGKIQITGQAAQGVLDHVINMEGVAQARSVGVQNGEIIIAGDNSAGVVRVASKVNASGKASGQKGGKVQVSGYQVLIDEPTVIDVSGDVGGGDINIGGNAHGTGPLPNSNATVMMPGAKLIADAITSGTGGNVVLWSDNVTKAYGSISALGGNLGGDGGFIETSSHNYLDVNGIQIDTHAPSGATGNWLLDPTDLTISTGTTSNVSQVGGTFTANNNSNTSILNTTNLVNQLGLTNVTVQTSSGGTGSGAGNITVANPVTWTSSNSLTISSYRNIFLSAALTNTTSSSASLTLRSNNEGAFGVGSGNGTINNDSTKINLTGAVNIYYNPSGLSTPTNFTQTGTGAVTAYMLLSSVNDINTLKGNTALWGSNYALSKNIDVSSINPATFIGNDVKPFTGKFDGQNFALDHLTINTSATSNVGFFGYTSGATIKNLGLTNVSIIVAPLIHNVGALVGQTTGSTVITNVYSTGTLNVTGSSTNTAFGGLIGLITGGTLTNSNSSVAITAAGASHLGGLVGDNLGTINNSYATGTISSTGASPNMGGLVGTNDTGGVINNSYSTGTVTSTTGNPVGGFVGLNNGTINRSYSSGSVSGFSNLGGFVGTNNSLISDSYSSGAVTAMQSGGVYGTKIGGFIGNNASTGSLTNVYSTGLVSGFTATLVGGLIGSSAGTVTNGFWNTQTSGQAASSNSTGAAGYKGMTTAEMMTPANFQTGSAFVSGTGFNFSTTWNAINGTSYPYLQVLNASTPRVISGYYPGGTATATGLGANTVRLAANGNNVTSITTGNNGFYYFFLPNGAIADSATLLLYLSGGSLKANNLALAPTSGGSLTGVNFNTNQIQVSSSGMNNASFGTALGALTSTDFLFSISGANLTLGTATSLTSSLASGVSYTINGNIASFSGANTGVSFTGPVSLGGFSITTTGNQNYSNSTLTLTGSPTLTSSANAISIGDDIAGGGNALIVNHATASNFTGAISNLSQFTKNGVGTLTLSGNNNYTGSTVVNTGILSIANANGLGNSSGVTLAANATLDINDVNIVTAIPITLNGSTLSGTGTAALAGNVTLTGGSNTISSNTTSHTFSLNGLINGASSLTLQGPGSIQLAANLGGLTPLTNMISNAELILGAAVVTSGNQLYNNPITLAANSGFTSNAGNVDIEAAVNGVFNLAINSAGTSTSGTIIGGVVNIANLVVNGAVTINTNNITTSGIQTYLATILLGTNTTLTGTTFNLINGISGNKNLNINGSSINLDGSLALHNVTLAGTSSNNTFTLSTNNTLIWNITGHDSGNVSGAAGISGATTYGNIQNIIGNSNSNTFNFADNATLSSVNGGSIGNGTNTVDYSAYTTPINITLNNNIASGSTENGNLINAFENIDNLIGNSQTTNTIVLPNKTNTLFVTGSRLGYINDPQNFNGFNTFTGTSGTDTVTITVPATINFANHTATINGVTMSFNNMSFTNQPEPIIPTSSSSASVREPSGKLVNSSNVASIMQQTSPNAMANNNKTIGILPPWMVVSKWLTLNMQQIIDQITKNDAVELKSPQIPVASLFPHKFHNEKVSH